MKAGVLEGNGGYKVVVGEVWVGCGCGVSEVWKRRGTVRLRMSLLKTG